MSNNSDPLHQISDIKQMMERSSRFMSLSGLSGVAVGVIGTVAAWLLHRALKYNYNGFESIHDFILSPFFTIALIAKILALVTVVIFTIRKSRKMSLPIWNHSSYRMIINLFIPILAGGIFIIKLILMGQLSLMIASSLIFYGLGLLNASKYTLGDIRFLAFIEIALGCIQLFFPANFIIWGLGFGLAHIVYGILLWNKYER